MFLNFEDKKKIVSKINNEVNKSLSVAILNFCNFSSNDLNVLRRDIKKYNSCIFVVRNSLLKISLKNTKFDALCSFISGPIFFCYSKLCYSSLSQIVCKYLNKYSKKLFLKAISINGKIISFELNKKLSYLTNIGIALKYFLFCLKNISIFKLLRVLVLFKNTKI